MTKLLLLTILPLLSADDASTKLLGRWRSLETSKGGIGAMFEFRKDGVVDYSPGAVVEMKYRIEGDQLVLPPATINGPELKETMEWPGKDKLRLKASGGPWVELTRAGPAPDVKNPILGEWTSSREMAGKTMEVRYLFYSAGKGLLLIPFLKQSGSYSIRGESIHFELPGRDPMEGKFKVDGDMLVIPGPNTGESRFARY
ncbi:MAG TPA: hypothetical protein VIX89_08510 [Bryobacteraceae bacterium]